jgi:hypothetical protein
MIPYLHSLIGLQSPQQVGFLLCVLLAFVLGWTMKGIRDERRARRHRDLFFKGVRLEGKKVRR